MKKRITSIFLVVMLAFLTGCGAKNSAKADFHTMIDTFQTGDVEKIKQYYDFSQESLFVNTSASGDLIEVVLGTMQNMKCKVETTEKIDDSTVKIAAKVTTLDFSQVMNLYIERLMKMVEDESYQEQVSQMEQADYQRKIAEQMMEILTTEEIATVEKTVAVTMVKQEDGTWLPGEDRDQFFGALFGNLLNAVHSLI